MANVKVVGPDEPPVELLKLRLNHHPDVLREFHPVIKLVWHSFGYDVWLGARGGAFFVL